MAQPFEWPETWTEERRGMLATLWWDLHLNGPIVDKTGRATATLTERLAAYGVEMSGPWLNKNLMEVAANGEVHLIDREIRGKRTYAIRAYGTPDREGFPPCPALFNGQRPDADLAKYRAKAERVEIVDEPSDPSPSSMLEPIDYSEQDVAPDGETPYNKCLFAISILTGLLEDLTKVPDSDIDQLLDRKLGAVNRLIEDHQRLQAALAEARAKNQTLLAANRKLEASLVSLQRSK